MIYQTLFTLHMIGLAIGAGTGVYVAMVNRHAARSINPDQARALMPGINTALMRVGYVGLTLLLLSGIGMMALIGGRSLGPWFTIKMVFVVGIILFVGMMHMLAARVRRTGDAGLAGTMKKLGLAGPTLALLTVIAAVAAFH